ncbi:MAG: GDSL-type esterase/lipase family protein [Flavobacteriales bacterium]|nr:GDSL-type esterase/lipase family protein [Flavobacteriales bacterium]MCX7649898.1 GDSL-type esterase/lipase family protein [Flavobacteriales bacterium]MDW8433073.1 GDSL-type esterase/lipase family protein [Flavobacteriales bacterium]
MNAFRFIYGLEVALLFAWSGIAAQPCQEGFGISYTRFLKEIRQFENSVSSQVQRPIVFYGSSSLRMWETLAQDFAPLPVVNRGFGGATLAEMNYYFERVLKPLNPSVIVAYGGENDLAHPMWCLDSLQKRFRTFMALRDKHFPGTPVVYILIKNSPKRAAFQFQFETFNRWVQSVAHSFPNLYLFDGNRALSPSGSIPPHSVFKPDSLHLGPEGYKLWAEGLRPVLTALYQVQSRPGP